MLTSRALTIPLVLFASLTLSAVPTEYMNDTPFQSIYYAESAYQTTSLNLIAKEYASPNLRMSALQLFGVQSNFSPDEQKTYQSVLAQKSQNVGINIFDLFTK